ncbi:SAM-dependent chlorinase/fluorinase [Candidatus Roizmanbacteria bacterium]|nr:SAM-dependent chlorinase/fluorinase [Candidatus Roizmanbacteria bacterium]
MKKLIVVADLANDSLSCAEIKIATEGFLKDSKNSNISFVSSTPSTIHTAFLINQLVEDIEMFGSPLETVIFQNTDPRLHSKESIDRAAGAKPLIIRLKSGIYLIGPNSGYDFSMIKYRVEKLFIYKGLNEKGQFHSRDLFSRLSAHLMDYMEDELELEDIEVDEIPNLSGYHIGHIDNFGNIKTTITREDFKGKYEFGDFINIKINKTVKKAKYVPNLFGGTPGELVIYPGSSGKKDNRYLEITIWRHFTEEKPTTGIFEFNFPKIGSEIELLS